MKTTRKVTFKLKKETLELASLLRSATPADDSVVEASFYVDAEDDADAFDQAAIKFAVDWFSPEYEKV